jgi:glycosyltransferase involved in cell wall biosynthesis
MNPKILIVGPIGDVGGRELETGFIAETLLEMDCELQLVSTIDYTLNSQVFDFIEGHYMSSLNSEVLTKSAFYRILAKLAQLKSNTEKPLSAFASNTYAKKLGFKSYALKTLKNLVFEADLIFFCAQLTSTYLKDIVEYANKLNKPIVLRTTGSISDSHIKQMDWLEKITLFIHHSQTNANRLSFLRNYNYEIIDQCTFKEDEFLKLTPTKEFMSLLYIGRLSKEKGIEALVAFIKTHKDIGLKLNIIGDGPLGKQLQESCQDIKAIEFCGYQKQDKVITHIQSCDAIIIPSFEEAGPLVGLEAMAAARLIISTKVGAMPHRLKNTLNQFWFEIDNPESLLNVISEIKSLTSNEIEKIANQNRDKYIADYKKSTIRNLYKNTIFNLILNNSE